MHKPDERSERVGLVLARMAVEARSKRIARNDARQCMCCGTFELGQTSRRISCEVENRYSEVVYSICTACVPACLKGRQHTLPERCEVIAALQAKAE